MPLIPTPSKKVSKTSSEKKSKSRRDSGSSSKRTGRVRPNLVRIEIPLPTAPSDILPHYQSFKEGDVVFNRGPRRGRNLTRIVKRYPNLGLVVTPETSTKSMEYSDWALCSHRESKRPIKTPIAALRQSDVPREGRVSIRNWTCSNEARRYRYAARMATNLKAVAYTTYNELATQVVHLSDESYGRFRAIMLRGFTNYSNIVSLRDPRWNQSTRVPSEREYTKSLRRWLCSKSTSKTDKVLLRRLLRLSLNRSSKRDCPTLSTLSTGVGSGPMAQPVQTGKP